MISYTANKDNDMAHTKHPVSVADVTALAVGDTVASSTGWREISDETWAALSARIDATREVYAGPGATQWIIAEVVR